MALSQWTFEVKLLSEGSYSSQGSYGQGGARQSTQSIQQKYLVEAIPPDGKGAQGQHDGLNDPDLMTEHYVGCAYQGSPPAPILPTVMGSVWYDPNTGLINPYAICMGKTIKRDTQNPYLFRADCNFKTKALETENCTVTASSISQATDISPEITVSVGGQPRVLYQDLANGNQCFMYDGIKERFAAPVTTDIPNMTLTISQYETAVSYAQILQRSYVTNSANYGGFGAGMWRCKVSNVSNVDVQTSAGVATWARVTYEVTLSQDGYYDPSGSFQLTGWKHQVPLIASQYLSDTDDEEGKPFLYEKTGLPKMGMIDSDGTKATNQDKPDYLTFTKYRSIDFTTFLQV